ncbi:MAG: VWA domain-containing protein [Psychrobium sp.]
MNSARLWIIICSTICLLVALLKPVKADDTEIFLVSQKPKPKVMMLLDTSRSMKNQVGQTNKSRLTTMQEAITEFIRQSEGVDIGLSRMNENTGAVIYPVTNLDETLSESFNRFNRVATRYSDMAAEAASKSVKLGKVGKLSFKDNKLIALRFANIPLSKNDKVVEAFIELTPAEVNCFATGGSLCPTFRIPIFGERSANSLPFNSIKASLTTRPRTSNTTNLRFNSPGSPRDWYYRDTTNFKGIRQPVHKLGDLSNIINEITSVSGWQTGNAITLMLDVSDITNAQLGGVAGILSGLNPVLFIRTEKDIKRTITGREKLIEELYNQRLTFMTPTVPALFDTLKYLSGETVKMSVNPHFNTSRTATEHNNYWRYYERLSHPKSFKNGNISYPTGCFEGWENSIDCKDIRIVPTNGKSPKYISPLTDACEETATVVVLTDGFAVHNPGSHQTNHWWYNTINEIKNFPDNNLVCHNDNRGQANKRYPLACSQELVSAINKGVFIEDSIAKKFIDVHTIGFNVSDAWLEKIARLGNGQYFQASDHAGLKNAFERIQSSVLSKTTTFSSAPVSIDSTNRLSHNNDLYYTLFQPTDKTSWQGNLKRYKVSADGNIIDINKQNAFDKSNNSFYSSAVSFWSSSADGDDVLQGGVREHLTADRKLFVNNGNSLIRIENKTEFTSKFTPQVFDVDTTQERDTIISQMLSNQTLADPLHSTPVVVSYPKKNGQSQNSVVFFGDNQGYLHAIDVETGQELYAFIPKELLAIQAKVFAQTKGSNHIYGLDGKISSWKQGNDLFITVGMRRGGASYYTLKVTNRNKPALAYVISPQKSGFENLGQTWSAPKVINVSVNDTVTKALIFGGGYDKEQDNATRRQTDNVGDGIYLVRASNGSILSSQTGLGYSIPSDVKAIDLDGDKIVDQVYVGDMGGRLLRFNMSDGYKLSQAQIIANIADNTISGNRRFYNAPDVSILKGSNGTQLAIAIGSGFRAHPKNNNIQDEFYLFKQPVVPESNPTAITHARLIESVKDIADDVLKTYEGWFFKLSKSRGEKVLASSTTADNAIWFTTFEPTLDSGGCSIGGGTSHLYRINVRNGLANYKNTLPEMENGQAKVENSCDKTECDISDRSVELTNATIPPAPVLIHVPRASAEESGTMLCVGTMCNALEPRKIKSTFWREGR